MNLSRCFVLSFITLLVSCGAGDGSKNDSEGVIPQQIPSKMGQLTVTDDGCIEQHNADREVQIELTGDMSGSILNYYYWDCSVFGDSLASAKLLMSIWDGAKQCWSKLELLNEANCISDYSPPDIIEANTYIKIDKVFQCPAEQCGYDYYAGELFRVDYDYRGAHMNFRVQLINSGNIPLGPFRMLLYNQEIGFDSESNIGVAYPGRYAERGVGGITFGGVSRLLEQYSTYPMTFEFSSPIFRTGKKVVITDFIVQSVPRVIE